MSNIYTVNELPIVQTEIRQIQSSPQGVLDGYIGYIVVNNLGQLWIKTSAQGTLTGWKVATTS